MDNKWKELIRPFVPPNVVTFAKRLLGEHIELHRSLVGGIWNEVGKLQFAFLVK